jgi:hypothetical protein
MVYNYKEDKKSAVEKIVLPLSGKLFGIFLAMKQRKFSLRCICSIVITV